MDHVTHEPLMLAYMNAESLRMTMELGEAVYYSRSRQEIWHKGATSGHVQKVKQILIDCDQDALIVLVDQCGAGACHTGHHSCFYRSVPFGEELKAQPQGQPVTLREADGGVVFLTPRPCTARAINSFCASICVHRVDAPSFCCKVMNVKKLLVMMAAVSGTLVLCQCSSEAPPPPEPSAWWTSRPSP